MWQKRKGPSSMKVFMKKKKKKKKKKKNKKKKEEEVKYPWQELMNEFISKEAISSQQLLTNKSHTNTSFLCPFDLAFVSSVSLCFILFYYYTPF